MGHDITSRTDAEDESLDIVRLKEVLSLLARAPRRHPFLAAVVCIAVSGLGIWRALVAELDYQAEASLVVQRNLAIPTFSDSSRPGESDAIASAVEAVKGRDNLLALAREMHLAELLPRSQKAAGAAAAVDEERIVEASKVLDRRLGVKADGNIITFVASWTDARTAYELANAAMHKFLDTRNAAEVSIISDSIALREAHAQAERDEIDTAIADLRRTTEAWRTASSPAPAASGTAAPLPLARARASAAAAAPPPELTRSIEDKRRQIRETDEEHRRQLAEARAQLAGLLATYTPSHPSVVSLRRRIEALSDDPPQLAALKDEERELLQQVASLTSARTGQPHAQGGGGPAPAATTTAAPTGAALVPARTARDLELVDPPSAIALATLQNCVRKYEELMDQIGSAKLQLDLARNTFKYRYRTFRPAQLPEKPRRPLRHLWAGGGVVLGVLLGVLGAATADLAAGRFVEPWQVKRRLSLPLLGEAADP